MFAVLTEAYESAAERLNIPIIPTGTAVETARALKEFDPQQGGLALTRDLNYLYPSGMLYRN